MEGILFNYLNRTWIVKKLKRFGIMGRTEPEKLKESGLKRMIKEYNLIQRKESKMSKNQRDTVIKTIEDLAGRGIITLNKVHV